jgi:hypothetical protein
VFDFRYHALSLAAVLVALVIGLLLGIAVGDSQLVSTARDDLRGSLRSDVRDANAKAAELRKELAFHERYEGESYPPLVAGRLSGTTIGVIGLGALPDNLLGEVRSSLDDTGGRLVLASLVREPIDVGALAGAAAGTRYEAMGDDADLIEPFGYRMGVQLVRGGHLLDRVKSALFSDDSGRYGNLGAVAMIRRPLGNDVPDDQRNATEAFENGLVRGLRSTGQPLIGIETVGTEPSQVKWFDDHGITSVDDMDLIAGHAAFVLSLSRGITDRAFGVKTSADALLPEVVGPSGG